MVRGCQMRGSACRKAGDREGAGWARGLELGIYTVFRSVWLVQRAKLNSPAAGQGGPIQLFG